MMTAKDSATRKLFSKFSFLQIVEEDNLPKYMIPPMMFLMSMKNARMVPKVIAPLCSFIPTLAITNFLSSSVSQRASCGKSGIRKKAAMPISMVTMPSRMKIHLQLLNPCTPSILAIALARRPPKAVAAKTEHQKNVKRR